MKGGNALARLPQELLEQVVQEVEADPCDHATVAAGYRHFLHMNELPPGLFTPAQARSWMREKGAFSTNGLASLCLVSRQLNQLANPRLYRNLDSFHTNTGWYLLARTLVTRRDLASLVRHLDVDELEVPEDLLPLPIPEVAAYYADQAALVPDPSLPADGITSSDYEEVLEAATAIMASLCPNLETLDCRTYCVSDRDGLMCGLCMPASMPNLQVLALTHYDSMYGFDLGELSSLLRAAPNLTTLHLEQAAAGGLPDDLKLEKVTFVNMRGTIHDGDLIALLRLCPNAEELQYECIGPCFGEDQFGPREAVDAVVTHAPRLKVFGLDLYRWNDMDVDFNTENMRAAKRMLEGARIPGCSAAVG
ncbi:hypothetical protein OQA88_11836 [Cercophora sp. LCS_1]